MRGKYPNSSTCIDDPPRREVRDALAVLGSAPWTNPLSQGNRGQNKHVSAALRLPPWKFPSKSQAHSPPDASQSPGSTPEATCYVACGRTYDPSGVRSPCCSDLAPIEVEPPLLRRPEPPIGFPSSRQPRLASSPPSSPPLRSTPGSRRSRRNFVTALCSPNVMAPRPDHDAVR